MVRDEDGAARGSAWRVVHRGLMNGSASGTAARMTVTLVGAIIVSALIAAGCATSMPAVPQDPHEMVGSWGGWLIKQRSFGWINLDIRDDATFDLTGEWGISSIGILFVRDGRVRFEGSRAWSGTLTMTGAASGPVLKLERDDRTEEGSLRRWPAHGHRTTLHNHTEGNTPGCCTSTGIGSARIEDVLAK